PPEKSSGYSPAGSWGSYGGQERFCVCRGQALSESCARQDDTDLGESLRTLDSPWQAVTRATARPAYCIERLSGLLSWHPCMRYTVRVGWDGAQYLVCSATR